MIMKEKYIVKFEKGKAEYKFKSLKQADDFSKKFEKRTGVKTLIKRVDL